MSEIITGSLKVDGTDDLITLAVNGSPSQTADIARWTPASGASLTQITANGTIRVQDTSQTVASAIQIEHSSTEPYAYGLEVHNYAASKSAIVIHNYSDAAQAMIIDNVRSKALMTLRNTENNNISPGTKGNGRFFEFIGYDGTYNDILGYLGPDMIWRSFRPNFPYAFKAEGGGAALKLWNNSGPAFEITSKPVVTNLKSMAVALASLGLVVDNVP